jgi:signal-transduction protein with cAMP-binding, CBS, and nucleotidyltransferase domain|tara:strand:+ start:1057 stop:1290 length:234 start_codon:yes stop_codon:yes gene_type:complete
MKLTNRKLKQIIKEEIQKALTEDKKSELEAAARRMSDESLQGQIKRMSSSKKRGGITADGELRLKVLKAEAAKRKAG